MPACSSTSLSDAEANARADEAIPPPRSAISSYGTPVTFCSYSSARQPANGRWVWQSTRPGSSAPPDASMASSCVVLVERHDQPVAHADRARPERQLRGAVVAQEGQPVLGWAQQLGGAAHADAQASSSIGTRTPRSRATAIASG